MPQRFTKPYPPEYRAEAIRLVREGGRDINDVAATLGISDQSLRNWVNQADIEQRATQERSDHRGAAGAGPTAPARP